MQIINMKLSEIHPYEIIGTLPKEITLKTFRNGLPPDWEEQKKMLGIGGESLGI